MSEKYIITEVDGMHKVQDTMAWNEDICSCGTKAKAMLVRNALNACEYRNISTTGGADNG